MSRVTSAILTAWCGEDFPARLKEVGCGIAGWSEVAEGQNFVSVKDASPGCHWYGGAKWLECEMAIAAFNYVGDEGIAEAVLSARWKYPDQVQVIVKGEEDMVFRLLDLSQYRRAPQEEEA